MFESNSTLMQQLLLNKGKDIRMPLASTFNRQTGSNMLSKDQLLMIQKSTRTRASITQIIGPAESYNQQPNLSYKKVA